MTKNEKTALKHAIELFDAAITRIGIMAGVSPDIPADIPPGLEVATTPPISYSESWMLAQEYVAATAVTTPDDVTPKQLPVAVAPAALDPNDRWLTIAKAAIHTGLSRGKLRKAIHDGRLKVSGVGKFTLDRIDVDKFMAAEKRIVGPYREGTRPWVAQRHLKQRPV
jgi:excisionase family DNA binding protein